MNNQITNQNRYSQTFNNQHQHQQRSNNNNNNKNKSHAFGGYDSESSENYPEEDDDEPGFGVYKDQNQSNSPRYTNLNGNSTPSSYQTFDQSRTSDSSRVPLYPPQTIASPTTPTGFSPLRQNFNQANSPLTPTKPIGRDLVQMPALGSDWGRDEARKDKEWDGKPKAQIIDRTKIKQNTVGVLTNKLSEPKKNFRRWIRGEHSYGGWFSRWIGLAIALLLLILAILLLIFLIPRQPALLYNGQTLMKSDTLPDVRFNRVNPSSFEFQTKLNLAFDGRNSYVNIKAHSFDATIKDLSSDPTQAVDVARGDRLDDGSTSLTISHKQLTPFDLRLKFSYTASSNNDTLWNNWYGSCGHQWPGNSTRPKIKQIGIVLNYKVSGLLGSFGERTIVSDLDCPVELPANSA